MGDRAYTVVIAWPWPDEVDPASELDRVIAGWGPLADVELLDDPEIGRIGRLVDEEANYGTAAYRDLIDALVKAGLNVAARNDAGGDYAASVEYWPADGDHIEVTLDHFGNPYLSAADVNPDQVDDAKLGALARKRLTALDAIPEAANSELWVWR